MAVFLCLPGLSDYAAVHALQQDVLAARVRDELPDVVLLLEHAEVITVGRARSAEDNVLLAGDVPVVRVERGGDVTWHGPGQLVAYPIIHLTGKRADLHLHLHSLEAAVIGLLGELGLQGVRDERNTGVWLPNEHGPARKVCSMGIACRRWVSWHGLALNVSVSLESFLRINPCGFSSDIMTTLTEVLPDVASVPELMPRLVPHLARELDVSNEGIALLPSPDLVTVKRVVAGLCTVIAQACSDD